MNICLYEYPPHPFTTFVSIGILVFMFQYFFVTKTADK